MSSIVTSSDTVRDFEAYTVYKAEELGNDWEEVPYLQPQLLQRFAGPDIDTCTFLFQYGRYAGQNISPLDLDRFYVKLVVRDLAAEAGGQSIDEAAHLIWYGVIEADDRNIGGTRTFSGTAVPHGDQLLTAYGLLRELETTKITTAVVETYDGDWQVVNRGLTFNEERHSRYIQRGNRTESLTGGYNGYIYSFEPQGQSKWTAYNALRYLIQFHPPSDAAGNTNAQWAVRMDSRLLDWFDISEETDGKTVKELLDALVDRRRIVGYFLDVYEIAGSGLFCDLNAFSFSDTPISLPGGKEIPANDKPVTLDFESAFDVELARLVNNGAHVVDKVRARGSLITSTFTVFLSASMLETGWSAGDETLYKAGGSASPDYPAVEDEEEQEAFNQRARSDDRFEDVYSRFVMRDGWDLKVPERFDDPEIDWYVTALPEILDLGTADDVTPIFQVGDLGTFSSVATRYHRFLSHLPIHTIDGDEFSEYRSCLTLFKTDSEDEDSDNHVWEYADKLNATAGTDSEDTQRRQFSCRVRPLEEELGIRLSVGASGAQQMIASESWSGAATTNVRYDPTTEEGNGVDFNKMVCTVAMEWDDHVEFSIGDGDTGKPVREMLISVPDARLDFLIPGTVTGIDDSGHLVQSENGSIIRDDRERLEQIATAAYQWYSKTRQALTLTWKSLAAIKDENDEKVQIGWLVTSVGGQYTIPDVRSPITAWAHDFVTGRQTIETSYAALDFSTQAPEVKL